LHELSLALNIVRIVEDRVAQGDISFVHVVYVQVGALTCVEPRALEFGFDAAKTGTVAEGAQLRIERCPAQARCRACPAEPFAVESLFEACPTCGTFDLEIVTGKELRVSEMEVD
jgi:hydrogenase nickel incorporation protein HypA/HybF